MLEATSYIRDPIHGSIHVTPQELKLIDSKAFQRLRRVKQMGFCEFAFPGATHSRFLHSLGAMEVASRMFQSLFKNFDLPKNIQTRFLKTVRLAALCHDLGHPPLSHTTENLLKPILPNTKKASHEHYTLAILSYSSFSLLLKSLYEPDDIPLEAILALFSGEVHPFYQHGQVDYAPILRQIISSECDADRMDYLLRDSFYAGVNYGKFDMDWLVENLIPIQNNQTLYMGLKSKAIFAFEDFLLSRYHMFLSIYFHHTPVVFENMLEVCLKTDNQFNLPNEIEAYLELDDISLWAYLKESPQELAKRIYQRQPYYLLLETRESDSAYQEITLQNEALKGRLEQQNIPYFYTESKSVLSKYFGSNMPFYIVSNTGFQPLEAYTPLYERYRSPLAIKRFYIHPDHKERAMLCLNNL